ncbi:MAG: hypothetical protein KA247_09820 [Bacteroidetes bacterium]|nr:hypothetical protein [Bacteroidota bacterium]
MKRLSLIVLVFCIALPMTAMKIPSQVKKSVAFIFVKDSVNRLSPVGTGFFMLLNAQQNGDTANFGYLVTTKSSVRTMNGKYYDSVYIRINRKDGYSDTLIIPLTLNGVPRYFVHPDSTVDLAMVPAYPDAGRYDFLFTPVNMIASVDFLRKEIISEGDEFFSAGMLSSHIGLFKNIPAVRFSRMIQLSEEKYPVLNNYSELFVIDSPFSIGSNGSPLYYYVPATKDSAGSAKFLLAGVVSGHFPRSLIERTGLTSVVPGYRLTEMMNLPAVAEERDKEFQRLQQGKKK